MEAIQDTSSEKVAPTTEAVLPEQPIVRRAICYCRVSPEGHAEVEKYSLPAQEAQVLEFCKAQGWEIVKVYQDTAHGGTFSRQKWKELEQDLDSGVIKADVFVVAKIDRFARTLVEGLAKVDWLYKKHGLLLVSFQERINATTPEGRLVLSIFLTLAEWELNRIKQRTREALHRKMKDNSKAIPPGRPPFGYRIFKRFKEGKMRALRYDPVPVEIERVKACFNEYATTGISFVYLKNKYSLPDTNSVRRLLQSRFYLGEVKFAGSWIKEHHERVIEEAVWQTCQDKIAQWEKSKE